MQQHPSYSTVQDQMYPSNRDKIVDNRNGGGEMNSGGVRRKGITTNGSSLESVKSTLNKNNDDAVVFENLGSHYDAGLVGKLLDANLTKLTRHFSSFDSIVGADFLSVSQRQGVIESPIVDDLEKDSSVAVPIRDCSTISPVTVGGVDLTYRSTMEDQTTLLGSYLPFVLQ